MSAGIGRSHAGSVTVASMVLAAPPRPRSIVTDRVPVEASAVPGTTWDAVAVAPPNPPAGAGFGENPRPRLFDTTVTGAALKFVSVHVVVTVPRAGWHSAVPCSTAHDRFSEFLSTANWPFTYSSVVFLLPLTPCTCQNDEPSGATPVTVAPLSRFRSSIGAAAPLVLSTRNDRSPACSAPASSHNDTRL